MAEIDPSIALGYNPSTKLQTPDQSMAGVLTLKNLFQQNQMGQQQLQTAQLENQQRTQDWQDQQNLRRAWTDAGGDLTKTQENAMKYGVSPKAMMSLNASILDQKTKLATLDKDTLANQAARNDQLSGIVTPIAKETDPSKQQSMWNAALAEAQNKGLMSPQEALQHPYPGPDGVKTYASHLLTRDQITKQITAEAEANKNTSEAAKNNALLPKFQAEAAQQQLQAAAQTLGTSASQQDYDTKRNALPHGVASQFPDKFDPKAVAKVGMTPDQQVTTAETAAHNQATEQNAAGQLAVANRNSNLNAGRLSVEQQGLALRKQQIGGGSMDLLSPANQSVAKQLAGGDLNPTLLARMPGKEGIIAAAAELNPAWAQAFATKKSFTDPSSGQSKNLGTISRIVGHIDRFEKNSKALGTAPAYAMGANLTAGQTATASDAHAISSELEKLVSGGVGTEGQVKEWQKGLHSPLANTRQAAVNEISQLVGSQYEGMNQSYKAGIGSDLPLEKFVSPRGIQWMKAKGINVGGTVDAPAPAATNHGIPDLGSTFNGGKVLKVTPIP